MISVILPTYNQSRFIERAMNSILTQEGYDDFEVIVVNDGSTDETKEELEKYAGIKGVKIYNNDVNKGLPASLNIGHEKSVGDYCTWISTDNMCKLNYLKTLHDLIVENDLDFIQTGYEVVDSVKNRRAHVDICKKVGTLKVGNLGPSFLYKRKVWEEFNYDENLHGAEDLKFYMEVKFRSDFKMGCFKDNLVLYNYQKNSISVRDKDLVRNQCEILREEFGL